MLPTHQDTPAPSSRSRFPGRHARSDQLFPHPELGYVGKHEVDEWTIHDAYQAGVADGHMEEAYNRDSVEPITLDTGFGPVQVVSNCPQDVWLPGMGSCICRGTKHSG